MKELEINIPESSFESSASLPKDSLESSNFVERKWRNAGRYQEQRTMKRTSKSRLWWVILATIIAFFWILQLTIRAGISLVNILLGRLQELLDLESLYIALPPASGLICCLIILLLFSPWLLDSLLTQYYYVQKFPKDRLESQYSETYETLKQFTQKYHRSQPKLKIINTPTPLIITYASLPFTSRIIVSNGLLQSLSDEELATIFATQLGQILNGDVFWMSLILTILQIPYLIYWQLSSLAETKQLRRFRMIFAFIAALFYGLYWLWKTPSLWLSRQRVYYSDRFAVELTGNPNALSRALLKIAIAISEQIQKNGYTPRVLESFGLALPIDPQQSLSLGSLPPDVSFETVLEWECTNPYRHWISPLASHPLIGERLYLLTRCAQFWHLESEFDLNERRPSLLNKAELWTKIKNCHQALPLLPRAFLFALGFGVVLRCLFWGVGKISDQLHYQPLVWMHTTYPLLNAWVGWLFIVLILILIFLFSKRFPHIFTCVVLLKTTLYLLCEHTGGQLNWLRSRDPFFEAWMMISLSFTLIIWLNSYFPSRQKSLIFNEPSLSDLLGQPDTLPSQGQIVSLSGRLLGHSGIGNWLGQDLILQTTSGSIRLHFLSAGGPLGEILSLFPRPCQYVNQLVTVRGWFRRGGSPWIDVELMATSRGQKLRGGYQMWLTLMALGCAVWGAYQIINI